MGLEFVFGERAILDLWPLGLGLGDRTRVQTELDLFTSLVVCHVRGGDPLHTENLHFVAITTGQGVFNPREIVGLELMNLLNVDR